MQQLQPTRGAGNVQMTAEHGEVKARRNGEEQVRRKAEEMRNEQKDTSVCILMISSSC